MKKIAGFLTAVLCLFMIAGCQKDKNEAKALDPVKGKMFAFTDDYNGFPSMTTIEFGMNSEVSIVNALFLPEGMDNSDSIQRITGTYVYDPKVQSIFIRSNEETAEEGYQVVFEYDPRLKVISKTDEYGNYLALEEVEINE